MYKCTNCTEIFSSPATVAENIGEYMGRSAYYNLNVCPYCKWDDYVKVYQCKDCGDYFEKDELIENRCESCHVEWLEEEGLDEWFNEIVQEEYIDAESVLEDIMMTHDLTPESTFSGYYKQMKAEGHAPRIKSYDDLREWLYEFNHI